MKVPAGEQHSSAAGAGGTSILTSKEFNQNPHQQNPDSDLAWPPRRRTRSKRVGPSVGRRSRPDTPLLKWKVEGNGGAEEVDEDTVVVDAADDKQRKSKDEGKRGRRQKSSVSNLVSARKLAAGLWRLQSPVGSAAGGGGGGVERRSQKDGLGFQPGAAHVGVSFLHHETEEVYGSEFNEPFHISTSASATKNNKLLCKQKPSFQFSNSAMEGSTKWDPIGISNEATHQIHSHMKRLDQQVSTVSVVTALEAELNKARLRIHELETERQSSKKKLEHFLKKVSEERTAWKSREHEKIRAFVNDIKADLSHERKSRQRLESLNSKLVNELSDTKVSTKRLMQDYGKERKARELIEEVCDELAREIGDDKAEIEAITRESLKMREEVDDERKMLQMAEVWREERVQMKLVDAKVALEEKYSQMNMLLGNLADFLKSKGKVSDIKQAESLMQAAASIDMEEVKEFTYEPPNQDDIFAVLEEVHSGLPNERDIDQCHDNTFSPASHGSNMHTASPEANFEDESGWETVSHLDDQGSSFSPEGSAPSVNKEHYRYSNVLGSGGEWEDIICKETPISEVCGSTRSRQQGKKVSAIARLWKYGSNGGDSCETISGDGMNGRLCSGRKSSAGIVSSDKECSPSGQWSSAESGISQLSRGMKGCMEWPKGAEKHIPKSRLMESQKLQLRHVLKQKI